MAVLWQLPRNQKRVDTFLEIEERCYCREDKPENAGVQISGHGIRWALDRGRGHNKYS